MNPTAHQPRIGLDTSVVLRLLTGTPPRQFAAARKLLANAGAPVTISDLVVSESYFALRHHYAVPHAEAIRALGSLLGDSRVHAGGVARRVLASLAALPATAVPGLVDRLIHADYDRDSISVATFDRDLARLAGVKVLAE